MKTLIALSLFVAIASSAGILPAEEKNLPLVPLKEMEGRITNGEIATRGQFPYQVGVSLHMGDKRAWCGGTSISNRWVVTAGHCAHSVDGVTLYFGAQNINNDTEKGQQRIYVSKSNIVVHPSYAPTSTTDDIALIKSPVPIEFNELIQPATLPKKNGKYSTYEGELVWASGWGKESDSVQSVSPLLRYIEVPVMNQTSCNKYFLGQVTDNMICIKTTDKKSTCNGDSGGPLVYKDGDVNYLVGATSFGIVFGCEKGWPGVFTRVTAYLDWIEKVCGVVNK